MAIDPAIAPSMEINSIAPLHRIIYLSQWKGDIPIDIDANYKKGGESQATQFVGYLSGVIQRHARIATECLELEGDSETWGQSYFQMAIANIVADNWLKLGPKLTKAPLGEIVALLAKPTFQKGVYPSWALTRKSVSLSVTAAKAMADSVHQFRTFDLFKSSPSEIVKNFSEENILPLLKNADSIDEPVYLCIQSSIKQAGKIANESWSHLASHWLEFLSIPENKRLIEKLHKTGIDTSDISKSISTFYDSASKVGGHELQESNDDQTLTQPLLQCISESTDPYKHYEGILDELEYIERATNSRRATTLKLLAPLAKAFLYFTSQDTPVSTVESAIGIVTSTIRNHANRIMTDLDIPECHHEWAYPMLCQVVSHSVTGDFLKKGAEVKEVPYSEILNDFDTTTVIDALPDSWKSPEDPYMAMALVSNVSSMAAITRSVNAFSFLHSDEQQLTNQITSSIRNISLETVNAVAHNYQLTTTEQCSLFSSLMHINSDVTQSIWLNQSEKSITILESLGDDEKMRFVENGISVKPIIDELSRINLHFSHTFEKVLSHGVEITLESARKHQMSPSYE